MPCLASRYGLLTAQLTVRDAQRNARDTEILVTLVRSAAEMRTSFEEMKKFIAQQDGLLMESSDKQHDRTYNALGSRPIPTTGRTRQGPEDDSPAKRKNVFKRALKGLSLKSSNDLGRVEDMLEQLLEEVEVLRAAQNVGFPRSGSQPGSLDQNGYEAGDQPGIPSPGEAAYLHNSARAAYDSRAEQPRGFGSRVEPVQEVDEDVDADELPSPNARYGNNVLRHQRAESAPLEMSPHEPVASGALSTDASPKANEKTRKHKSSSSSFFPKISRWSKTTASSMGDNIRNSVQPARKERPFSEASRSGSDLQVNSGQYKARGFYDPEGDDRIRSNLTLDEQHERENRPPSPLVPSQVSEAPKYRAHRDSFNLQHPQPRQGPSERYHSQLESRVDDYGSPISPNPETWGSNPSLTGADPSNKRYSGASRLSPILDAGYSESSSRFDRQSAPPRPPKIKDEGPLIPERPPKIKEEDRYAERATSRVSLRNNDLIGQANICRALRCDLQGTHLPSANPPVRVR